MQQNLLHFFFWLLLLVGLDSCQNALNDPIIVPEVEDEFYVDLWEELSPDARRLQFQLETVKSENCLNYTIDYNYSRSGNRIQLVLEQILPPDDCQAGLSTVKATVNAGSLFGGFYGLNIALSNTVNNEGQLMINADRYLITLSDPAGIILRHTELLRVPGRTIWGYLNYPEGTDSNPADQFFTELSTLVETRSFLPGYYGYFSVTEEGQIGEVKDQPLAGNVRRFAYRLPTGQGEAVRSLLENFRQEYGGTHTIRLMTWEGESW